MSKHKYLFSIPLYPVTTEYDDEGYETKVVAIRPAMVQWVADSFNDDRVGEYIASDERYQYLKITNILAEARWNSNKVILTVETSRKLTGKNIASMIDAINGQCSDGWGEGLEQVEYPGHIYISTWKHGGENCRYLGEL